MKAIYSVERNEIREVIESDPYATQERKYADRFSGKTIPCNEECRTAFKDGDVLTEGKDYFLRFGRAIPMVDITAKQDNTNEDEQLVTVAEFTEIMRQADRNFESVGGSTRHFVQDCLFPILAEKGIKIVYDKS